MSHKRTKRMRQAKRRIEAEGRGYPWIEDKDCLPGHPMCHDCAFRKGSKEMVAMERGVSEIGADDGPGTMVKVIHGICKRLGKGKVPVFYCHHIKGTDIDFPTDEYNRYTIPDNHQDASKLVPICAGWRAMVERFRRVREEDEKAELEARG